LEAEARIQADRTWLGTLIDANDSILQTPPEQDAGIGGQHLHGLALHAVAECHCPARRLHRASTLTGAARSRQLNQLMEQLAHGTTSSWNNQHKKEAGQNNLSNKNIISFETLS
jgi:hypothetical protein